MVFPKVCSHGLLLRAAAPPRSHRLHLRTVTCGEDNGTARHAAWNGARPPVGAHACAISAHGPGPPRSTRRCEARHAWRWLQGKPRWSPHRGRHCGAGAYADSVHRHLAPQAIRRSGPSPRQVGAAPEPFRPASRSAGHRSPTSPTPTQARSRPAPPPYGALSARWGGATLGRGVATALDARTRSQPHGYVSAHVTPTRESPVKQQDVKKKKNFFFEG